ncbi:MAG: pyruvate, phosphate dikinase [Spirochaetes bacterium GWF1_31_7]|nr:MAG: pyruvate, phosphate dikinase [Spirochaetes bacterium GWE1_32_154]OHD50799.1 MAG: pyruvate, phosphate dikinase [Spirochaetes bacterium GWE2_31_10]OHD52736.1 MAG: pyruvate, phosphate dikinase [Spirochaetes bacterium GWF1_31_7]OHD78546.1 MAG: pyruvate, phosphate dikinase [Spirochaetes bacterium RIFOXYB1_FULL_32_8]HBD95411.1 pyruvate, phosphate dikinase [Spirochaetia bacterium]
MNKKYVYFFGNKIAEGNGSMKQILGGKGAGLAEMTRIGLPVPGGFTLTTEVCDIYYKNNKKYPEEVGEQVDRNLKNLEKIVGKTLGDPNDPLLVSVRSGASISMPGMMETILNLGLNDKSVHGLANKTGNRRFAYDAYRRFIMMYGSTAKDIEREKFDEIFDEIKNTKTRKRLGIAKDIKINDTDTDTDELVETVEEFKKLYKKELGTDFPQDPIVQLWGAIDAVFGSWMGDKAVKFREVEKITGILGTAVSVVQMVFGNMGDTSGTGVCFTRDPSTGENIFYGDYLVNAQGEDVVAGIRTPMKLEELDKKNHEVYQQLIEVRKKLEYHYRDMQDLEFTVEEGKLYMLQCRSGKRSPKAAFDIAIDFVNEGLISKEEAVSRIKPKDIEGVFYPVIDSSQKEQLKSSYIASGIDAVPGAAVGKVVFNAKDAEEWTERGEKVILVRKETSPEDVGGMHAAQGILTATGGKTSHAAVVARGWGKCCIVGCGVLEVDYEKKEMRVKKTVVKEGELITLDGSHGFIYKGALKLSMPELPQSYFTLMKWVDEIRKLGVRTNADTPYDAEIAKKHGAEGIGLCRTEHMFFDTEPRRLAIQEMIIADTLEDRKKALDKLLPFQITDFKGIFTCMNNLPVTIRLIDPPLHEFAPHTEEQQKKVAIQLGVTLDVVKSRVDQLAETNPMLGHRGCRLAVTYPEILEMQVTAIITAACQCVKEGVIVHPEIMIPLIIDKKEFELLEKQVRKVAESIISTMGVTVPYKVGTMIEIPRAALLADEIAEHAEFFSCGTNDLTQMTLGMSRDDSGRFLPDYVDEKKAAIFHDDPFQSVDQKGVGALVKMAVDKGRSVRKDLKVGVCGEHGGEAVSVKFFAGIGLDYVSCSPLRVPIARLAAAQYELEKKKR